MRLKPKPDIIEGERLGEHRYVRVVFAHEKKPCEHCGEPWCSQCNMHYATCNCLGPSEVDSNHYKTVQINGALHAMVPIAEVKKWTQ